MNLKRLFDFVAAAAVLILLRPLFLIVALAVRIFPGLPVLFSQQRPGRHAVPITLGNFRTMADLCNADGKRPLDGRRVTASGCFLRTISLDGLPERYNVLLGLPPCAYPCECIDDAERLHLADRLSIDIDVLLRAVTVRRPPQ